VLATATSRPVWLGTNLLVAGLGVVWLTLASGFATGIGAALVTGDGSYVWELAAGYVGHAPAVLLVMAIAAMLFGLAPRAIGATWFALVAGLFIGFFGPIMDLPTWVENLGPFSHIAQMPLEDFVLAPVLIMSAIAAAGFAVALVAFRQRSVHSN
jgi:ABC-2 type transport system permease protein